MIEVEVKLPIYKRPLTEKALQGLGFCPGDLVRESDIYFTSDFHDFMEADEALRIRTSDNLTSGKSLSVLTFKGPKLDAVSMTRKELETEIGDAGICEEILLSLGYRKLAPVNKLRQHYHLDPVTACVDQVVGLGSFLELEILVGPECENEPSAKDRALYQIESILHDLGHSMRETTRYSYLYMLRQALRQAKIQPNAESSLRQRNSSAKG